MSKTRFALLILAVLTCSSAVAQIDVWRDDPCCQVGPENRLVWIGDESEMTFDTLAAHCAPILWFSPDEPVLGETVGPDIRMPTAFPASLHMVNSPYHHHQLSFSLMKTREKNGPRNGSDSGGATR